MNFSEIEGWYKKTLIKEEGKADEYIKSLASLNINKQGSGSKGGFSARNTALAVVQLGQAKGVLPRLVLGKQEWKARGVRLPFLFRTPLAYRGRSAGRFVAVEGYDISQTRLASTGQRRVLLPSSFAGKEREFYTHTLQKMGCSVFETDGATHREGRKVFLKTGLTSSIGAQALSFILLEMKLSSMDECRSMKEDEVTALALAASYGLESVIDPQAELSPLSSAVRHAFLVKGRGLYENADIIRRAIVPLYRYIFLNRGEE